MALDTMAISSFKATCLRVLKQVKETRRPLLVTLKGEPIALISPPPEVEKPASWVGRFRDTGEITGDILSPAIDCDDWVALQS